MYMFFYIGLLFMIYAIIGWFIELIFVGIVDKKITNRGFLIGPYCPIYGFGAFTMIYVYSQFDTNPIAFFIMFIICVSLLEYFASYLLERIFDAKLWDYSNFKLNIYGRVCIIRSLYFGILGVACAYLLNPALMQWLFTIPNNLFYTISALIITVFLIDFLATLKAATILKKNINLLQKDMLEDFRENFTKISKDKVFIKATPLICQKIQNMVNKKRSS